MKNRNIVLYLIFAITVVSSCFAQDVKVIQWNDLIPEAHKGEDPMVGLSEEQRNYIDWIIYLRQNLPPEPTEQTRELFDEMERAIPKLKEGGMDIDVIIAKRQARDSSINEDLNDKNVTLAGYMLPLDMSGKQVREFLLVPYMGACIHTPPPPPNQIVHATFHSGIDHPLSDMFRPVLVTGKLSAQPLKRDLFLVDGSSNIDIGYSILVAKVEPYTP